MVSPSSSSARHVVLAGGGHAHALLIRQWGEKPLPGISLTLVSPDPKTPYSGMLPGLIAGHYDVEDIHIDLAALCRWANVRFVPARAVGIDGDNRRLELENGQWLAYDVLSLDIGSAPSMRVAGVEEHAIGIKPISRFWQQWQFLLEHLRNSAEQRQVAVVGGGAGSVEAILAMAWVCGQDRAIAVKPGFHLVFQSHAILPTYPARVRAVTMNQCRALGITLHNNFQVSAVASDHLAAESGSKLATDFVLWCTEAAAPDWLARSGLACTKDGFVQVNASLQSISHPAIFAAGDIAHMVESPRPKAGVYAVRQAPYLFGNIRHFLQGTPLDTYQPQDEFLSLLALGERRAVGSRGGLVFQGRWVWHLKDYIDRKFMARFHSRHD